VTRRIDFDEWEKQRGKWMVEYFKTCPRRRPRRRPRSPEKERLLDWLVANAWRQALKTGEIEFLGPRQIRWHIFQGAAAKGKQIANE